MSKRMDHDAAFKARVTLEALKGKRTVLEVGDRIRCHPTMIHPWKKTLLEGASGVFECGAKVASAAGGSEDTVRDLHAKIGERLGPMIFCHERSSRGPGSEVGHDRAEPS